jgi:hypothetical protein
MSLPAVRRTYILEIDSVVHLLAVSGETDPLSGGDDRALFLAQV